MSQTIDKIKPGYPLFKQNEYQDMFARKHSTVEEAYRSTYGSP